jgi:hypothetical protein
MTDFSQLIPVLTLKDFRVGDSIWLNLGRDEAKIQQEVSHLYPWIVLEIKEVPVTDVESQFLIELPKIRYQNIVTVTMFKLLYANGTVTTRTANTMIMRNPLDPSRAAIWYRAKRPEEE